MDSQHPNFKGHEVYIKHKHIHISVKPWSLKKAICILEGRQEVRQNSYQSANTETNSMKLKTNLLNSHFNFKFYEGIQDLNI